MRYMTITLLVCGLIVGTGTLAAAHEEHAEGGTQTLTGEVVDVACYLMHGDKGSGKDHADCGQKCVLGGLPVAIKSGDTLYFVVSKDHQPMNKELGPLVGHQVQVMGEVTERNEEHLLIVSTIKALD